MVGQQLWWHQDGWTVSVLVNAVTVPNPAKLVKMVQATALPAPHGRVFFTWGTPDSPSLAVFVRHGVRYLVAANEGRALALAARMRRVGSHT
jgi:hypothetical protein